jgi:hypothetical protein
MRKRTARDMVLERDVQQRLGLKVLALRPVAGLTKRHAVLEVVAFLWILRKRENMVSLHATLRLKAAHLTRVVVSTLDSLAPLDCLRRIASWCYASFPVRVLFSDLRCGNIATVALGAVSVELYELGAHLFRSFLPNKRATPALDSFRLLLAPASHLREQRKGVWRMFLAETGLSKFLTCFVCDSKDTDRVALNESGRGPSNGAVPSVVVFSDRRSRAAAAHAQAGRIGARQPALRAELIVAGYESAGFGSVFVAPRERREIASTSALAMHRLYFTARTA